MPEHPINLVPGLDSALLNDIARQDQRDPNFEVTAWSVESLSDKGIINPDGLFRVHGQGVSGAGERAWSVVLKALRDPGEAQALSSLWHWRREALAAKSGLLSSLPGPVRAPRFYGVTEQTGSDWLWMEHVRDEAGAWTLDHYARAAHALGCWNAAYLAGNPLPDAEWLCRGHARAWCEALSPENAWEDSTVQQFFSRDLRTRAMQMWSERERFYETLERLPQVFSHFDFQRRNLFWRRNDEADEIVAIDWAQCGIGSVGGDLYSLIGASAVLLEWPADRLDELEEAAFNAYVRGLRDGGWQGDAGLARLGYTAWIAPYWGMAVPAGAAFWFSESMRQQAVRQFGRPIESLAATFATLCDFSLRRGDEARRLMT